MTRSQTRVAVAGGAVLVVTGCLYLWTQPAIDWESLQQPLDALHNLRTSLTSSSSSSTSCSEQQVFEPPPVKLVRVSEDGAQYRLFHAPPPNSPDWTRLQPALSLPSDCLDAHVSTGAACGDPDAPTEQFDFVWTWSNGSEALHRKAYLAYEASTLPIGAKSQADQTIRLKLFREHDELRHSFRSVLQHFRPHVHKIHLVTGDLPAPTTATDEESSKPAPVETIAKGEATPVCQRSPLPSTIPRLGQVPAWLNTSQADGNVQIDVTHHSQYFTQYEDTVFNSLAIESQFPNLPNLHDHFIYMNDDFFFSADLTAADFYTKAYGTVFRVYPSRVIQPSSDRDPHSNPQAAETVALEWTSELISRRFGYRSRPYPSHESKVVSTPIFRELAAMFPEQLKDSGRARVRSQTGSKVTNVHMMALYLHFIVERHREAVLWSWAVGRMTQIAEAGKEDWVEAAWREVGGAVKAGSVEVRSKSRKTLSREHAQTRLGQEQGDYAFNAYRFSSDDGYPYASLGEKGRGSWPEMRKVDLSAKGHPHFKCTIERRRCFPTRDDLVAGYTPADFFQHIAFIDVECGDCVMNALVAASGELGLSAALPDAGPMEDPSEAVFDEPPHLPLVDNYFDGDFSVESVVPRGGDLRSFSVQLIHRYRYVMGRIFSGFSMLKNPEQAVKEFARLDKEINKGWMGVVCINDDIVKGAPEVDASFRNWQESRWHTPAAWEMF